jgi:hypothetical protein
MERYPAKLVVPVIQRDQVQLTGARRRSGGRRYLVNISGAKQSMTNVADATVRADATVNAIPVSPQRRRQAARDRLAGRTGPVVNRVLTELRRSRPGRDVARAGLDAGGGPNVEAVTILLNRGIRDFNGGIDREDLTLEQAEAAYANLDQLADTVRDRISVALERTS